MHHKRHRPGPSKDRKYGEPRERYREVSGESLPKRPAKKPKNYCTKLKGVHQYSLNQNDVHGYPTIIYEVWRCDGCGKKKWKIYHDGKLLK